MKKTIIEYLQGKDIRNGKFQYAGNVYTTAKKKLDRKGAVSAVVIRRWEGVIGDIKIHEKSLSPEAEITVIE